MTIDIDTRPWRAWDLRARVEVRDGEPQLVPADRRRWRSVLERSAGESVRVRISRAKRRRSLPQNAYLWGVVYQDVLAGLRELAEQAGERPVFADEDELHEAMKWKFLRTSRTIRHGCEPVEHVPSSALLSTEEFSEYVEAIARWAAELGIYVRHPHEEVRPWASPASIRSISGL